MNIVNVALFHVCKRRNRHVYCTLHGQTAGLELTMRTAVTIALALMMVALNASSLQAQQPAPSDRISLDSVRSIAHARWPINTGIKAKKVTYDNGVSVYEVRIGLKGPGHRELVVNARNGDVLADEYKADFFGWVGRIFDHSVDKRTYIVGYNVDKAEEIQNRAAYTEVGAISQDSARVLARKAVPDGNIKDMYLDRDDQNVIWKIKIETARGSEELILDGLSGQTLDLKRK
jgi:uncharacterized membrane protein YkoI